MELVVVAKFVDWKRWHLCLLVWCVAAGCLLRLFGTERPNVFLE